MNMHDLIELIKWEGRLTQQDIAKATGITQAHISRMRNNKAGPSLKTAQRIIILARKYKIKVKLEDIFISE